MKKWIDDPKYFVFSILFHAVLFFLLFVGFSQMKTIPVQASQAKTKIIHATAVDQRKVDKEIRRIKKQQRVKIAKQRADKLRAKRIARQNKLNKIKEQKELIALKKEQKRLKQETAEKKANLEKLQKTQADAEQKAKLKELMQKQLDADQKQLKSSLNQKELSEIEKYKQLIVQSIGQHWIVPGTTNKSLMCTLYLRLAPGGEVLQVKLIKSSGDTILDRSAQTAVYKASPLPVPKELKLFSTFREINIKVKPEGYLS